MKKLYLIRHGRTEANEKSLYCGSTDVPISDAGRTELLELKKEIVYPVAPRMYTSGMLRAEQTYEILFGDTEHSILPKLREMDFGEFEMKSYEELREDANYQKWIENDMKNRCPGGESGDDAAERVIAGLEEILSDAEDSLVVSHGGVIAIVMMYLFPEENKNIYGWRADNGHGYTVCFENGKPVSYEVI